MKAPCDVAMMSVVDKPSMATLFEQAFFQRARFAGDLRDRGGEGSELSPRATEGARQCVGFAATVPAFAFEQLYNVTGMHGMSLRGRKTKALGAVSALVVRRTITR